MASRPFSTRGAEGLPRLLAAAAAALLFFAALAPATCPAAEGGGKASPVVVTARSLLADNKKSVVVYKKDVVVKKDDITLYADEVVISLARDADEKAAGTDKMFKGAGKIKTIRATGGVKIIQKDRTATSDEALYVAGDEKIVLSGNPRVWQGQSVLSGESITYNLDEDTFVVEQARTILYQDDEGRTGPLTGGVLE